MPQTLHTKGGHRGTGEKAWRPCVWLPKGFLHSTSFKGICRVVEGTLVGVQKSNNPWFPAKGIKCGTWERCSLWKRTGPGPRKSSHLHLHGQHRPWHHGPEFSLHCEQIKDHPLSQPLWGHERWCTKASLLWFLGFCVGFGGSSVLVCSGLFFVYWASGFWKSSCFPELCMSSICSRGPQISDSPASTT